MAAWEQHRLGEAASLRILEKQGPFDHRCTKRKNLTHLQSILLFNDSSVSPRKWAPLTRGRFSEPIAETLSQTLATAAS
jgi:hypothetical protein